MKILITGGLGFIGSHLCTRLIAKNHDIFIIDNILKQIHGNTLPPISGFDFTCGDVSNNDSWKRFYGSKFDCLIHLAAETGTGQSAYEAEQYCKTNIQAAAIINDLIINNKIKFDQIVLASSRAVYGEAVLNSAGKPRASSETDPVRPVSIYGITKLTQENILLTSPYRSSVCVLRLQNVYGIGQSINNAYTGIISIFSRLVKHNKNITLFENGMASRDFVYIDDVIDSFVGCLGRAGTGGQIYNVGTGKSTSILTAAQSILNEFDSQTRIQITTMARAGDVKHNFANIKKIKNLGLAPKISFNSGIKMVSEWIKNTYTAEDFEYERSLEIIKSRNLLC